MSNRTPSISYDSTCCFRGNDSSVTQRLLWEITTQCNLSCAFCHRTPGSGVDVTRNDCQAIIPFLKEIGIHDVIVSGGEPLLNVEVYHILALLREAAFDVDICTNGTLVTPAIASQLSQFVSEVSVSIDSHSPATHDLLRQCQGAWQATVAGIRSLQEQGVVVHTLSLVSAETIEQIEQTADFLYSLGVRSIAFIGHIPLHTGRNALLSQSVQGSLRMALARVRTRYPDIAINSKELVVTATMTTCRAGECIYGLDAYMNLKPCILFAGMDGIDLRRPENRTRDTLLRVREKVRQMLIDGEAGQGLCPGSRCLNAQ